MALEKTVSDKGVTVKYWMIDQLTYSKIDDCTKVSVRGYVSKDIRLANIKDFINLPEFRYRTTFSGVKTLPQLYTSLQAESRDGDEKFSEAETVYGKLYAAKDVLEAGQTKE